MRLNSYQSGRQSRCCVVWRADLNKRGASRQFLKPIFMQNLKKNSITENKNCPKHCERPFQQNKNCHKFNHHKSSNSAHFFFSFNLKFINPTTLVDPSSSLQLPHQTNLHLIIFSEKINHMEAYQFGLSYVIFFLTEYKALSLRRSTGFLTMKNKLKIWG